jgi:hypothetical protein
MKLYAIRSAMSSSASIYSRHISREVSLQRVGLFRCVSQMVLIYRSQVDAFVNFSVAIAAP